MLVSQFIDRVDALLLQGLRELSMTLAVLARIENDNFEIVAVQSNSGAYVPGENYTLGDSFSRQVFTDQKIIAETSIDNSPETLRHPLYRSLPLECYLGAPVTLNGQPWGCLDFSSMAQRDEPFAAKDLRLIESLAGEISELLRSIENHTNYATANSNGP